MKKSVPALPAEVVGEVIDMALSDHVSFGAIKDLHGLNEDQVKTLMRANLKTSRYKAWRRRVQTFGARREFYKEPIPQNRSPRSSALDQLTLGDDAAGAAYDRLVDHRAVVIGDSTTPVSD
jgi:uncharacterized protein (TIGR03643 family)